MNEIESRTKLARNVTKTRRLVITQLPADTRVWVKVDDAFEGPFPAVAIANEVEELSWEVGIERVRHSISETNRNICTDDLLDDDLSLDAGPCQDLDFSNSRVLVLAPWSNADCLWHFMDSDHIRFADPAGRD